MCAIMSQIEAEKAARQMLMSGYRHHTYEGEQHFFNKIFGAERDDFMKFVNSGDVGAILFACVDVLAPTKLRAVKNCLICIITPLCRAAIEHGADTEISFALSDYYIDLLETLGTNESLLSLARQILIHYYELVQKSDRKIYCKPIGNAMRYIDRNIYGSCSVAEVAGHVGLEQHYFSTLFHKQVGVPPGKYILSRKLKEGRFLIEESGATVAEAAESLGFCNVSYFSRAFKEAYGLSPSRVGNIPRSPH